MNDLISFTLTDNETKAAREFMDEHKDCCHNKPFTALGMQFTYEITPGGFGDAVVIKCNKCKKFKDITDIDSW